MAAKLQCEICGGKLIGKPGGIFECDSCGMEYDTSWAKAKIQEIQGTVKVEGTVEVQGTVKVDGPVKVEGTATKETVLKRGFIALEDLKWDEAKNLFDEVLKAEPECAEAYLGLVMTRNEAASRTRLESLYLSGHLYTGTDFSRVEGYATGELKQWIIGLKKKRTELLEAEKRKKEETAKAEAAQERQAAARAERLAPFRARAAVWKGKFVSGNDYLMGVREDGTLLAAGTLNIWSEKFAENQNVAAIVCSGGEPFCIKTDGKPSYIEGIASSVPITIVEDRGSRTPIRVIPAEDVAAAARTTYQGFFIHTDGSLTYTTGSGALKLPDSWTTDRFQSVSANDGSVLVANDRHFEYQIRYGILLEYSIPKQSTARFADVILTDPTLKDDAGILCLYQDGRVALFETMGQFSRVRYNGRVFLSGPHFLENFTDIISVCGNRYEQFGLRADGTVVTTKNNNTVSSWKEIVAIASADHFVAGLRKDGTVVCAAQRGYEMDVSNWKLFETAEEKAARVERERKVRITELTNEQVTLQTELANLKGIFSGKRRKEIEARLAEIDAELKKPN